MKDPSDDAKMAIAENCDEANVESVLKSCHVPKKAFVVKRSPGVYQEAVITEASRKESIKALFH